MSLNPLFAVELRGRFRRLTAFAQLALAIAAGALLIGILIQLSDAATAPESASGVASLHAQGAAILLAYRLWGGLLYAFVGVLVGAMSIITEKNAGTFEHLLLCPLRAGGIVRGKVASSLAFLLMLQLVLLPLLLAMGAFCLLPPAQVLWIAALHFGISAQGVTLGILGAVRARSVGAAIAGALGWWISIMLLLGLVAYLTAIVVGALYVLLNIIIAAIAETLGWWGIANIIKASWQWASDSILIPLGWSSASLAGGLLGVAALVEKGATIPLVFVGQMLGVIYFARWAAWQLHSPNRRLAPLGWDASQLLFRRWSWQLSPLEIALFPVAETHESPTKRAPSAAPTTKSGQRIRLVSARWLSNVNPVFWLDLQRCLSLRAPTLATQLPLLLFAALGSALALSAGMAGLVSLLVGGKSDADLGELYATVHWILCYLALVCGPLFATTGYVIERRSMMLHELRLTLLSARQLWWGKLASRWIIPIIGALPGLMLLQFFANNMSGAPRFALLAEGLLIFSIAAASIGVCLWLSYHAENSLAAALWCLGFAIVVGGPLWNWGQIWWPPLKIVSPLATHTPASCALFYVAVAALSNGSIGWKLRRMGFG